MHAELTDAFLVETASSLKYDTSVIELVSRNPSSTLAMEMIVRND
jgi:hypothetical protein